MPDIERIDIFPRALLASEEINPVLVTNTTNITFRQNSPNCTKQLVHLKARGHVVCHWLSLVREYRIFFHLNSIYVSRRGIFQDEKLFFPHKNITTKNTQQAV